MNRNTKIVSAFVLAVVAVAIFAASRRQDPPAQRLTGNQAAVEVDNNTAWAQFKKPEDAELHEILTPLQY